MQNEKNQPATIDEYIAQCPLETRPLLNQMRAVIREAAPQAEEMISYGMPGFQFHGSLAWFAPHPGYLGFYPTGSGVAAFKAELADYECTKGSVHLPLDQPIPVDLIQKMVKFKLAENVSKAEQKKKSPARKAAKKED